MGVWGGHAAVVQLFNWCLPQISEHILHARSSLRNSNSNGALSNSEEEFGPLNPVSKYWCRGSVLARQLAYSGCSSAYQWDRGCDANLMGFRTKIYIHHQFKYLHTNWDMKWCERTHDRGGSSWGIFQFKTIQSIHGCQFQTGFLRLRVLHTTPVCSM